MRCCQHDTHTWSYDTWKSIAINTCYFLLNSLVNVPITNGISEGYTLSQNNTLYTKLVAYQTIVIFTGNEWKQQIQASVKALVMPPWLNVHTPTWTKLFYNMQLALDPYHTMQCNTTQHNTIQYNTIQYNTM